MSRKRRGQLATKPVTRRASSANFPTAIAMQLFGARVEEKDRATGKTLAVRDFPGRWSPQGMKVRG